MRLGQKS